MGLITLLSYQEAATLSIEHGIDELKHKRLIVKLPTGTGKTILALAAARKFMRANRVKRVLWITQRKELVEQPIAKLSLVWPEVDFGVVRGQQDEWYARDIVFATVQSASQDRRLATLLASQPGFDLVIVDEAHHACSPSHRKILDKFPDAIVIGLTATPGRADKRTLSEAGFTAFAFKMSIPEAIRFDYLCPYTIERHPIKGFDLSKCKTTDGDFDADEQARLAKQAHVAEETARIYHERMRGLRTLIFCPRVDMAQDTAKALKDLGVSAEWVSEEASDEDRTQIVRDFQARRFLVLCNVGLYTEGYDDPALEAIFIQRCTKSRGLLTQICGRVLRKAPGKRRGVIAEIAPGQAVKGLAHAAGVLAHKNSDAEEEAENEGLPVLGGVIDEETDEAIDEILDEGGEDISEETVEKKKRDRRADAVNKILDESTGGESITVHSQRVAWIDCDADLFAIPVPKRDPIVLKPIGDEWIATQGLEVIARHSEMSLVQGIAEQRARAEGALSLTPEEIVYRSGEAGRETLSKLWSAGLFYVAGMTNGEVDDTILAMEIRLQNGRSKWPS